MQAVKANRTSVPQNSVNKLVIFALILAVLLIAALYGYNAFLALRSPSIPQGVALISQQTLEEKYGLRVNLVAVTAAGGFVDVRLKIVDGEKLKLLLSDRKNFPVLLDGRGVMINAPEDTKSQKIEFITGGNLYIMYPNSGNAIKRDSPVTILFGDIALEPIHAN